MNQSNPNSRPGTAHDPLLERLEAGLQRESLYTERETLVSRALGPRMRADLVTTDFYGSIHIYKVRMQKSRPVDLYQLRMYIDGKVHDGSIVAEGVLVASTHSDDVRRLVRFLNTQEQEDGVLYHFELKTWQDFGIDLSALL